MTAKDLREWASRFPDDAGIDFDEIMVGIVVYDGDKLIGAFSADDGAGYVDRMIELGIMYRRDDGALFRKI